MLDGSLSCLFALLSWGVGFQEAGQAHPRITLLEELELPPVRPSTLELAEVGADGTVFRQRWSAKEVDVRWRDGSSARLEIPDSTWLAGSFFTGEGHRILATTTGGKILSWGDGETSSVTVLETGVEALELHAAGPHRWWGVGAKELMLVDANVQYDLAVWRDPVEWVDTSAVCPLTGRLVLRHADGTLELYEPTGQAAGSTSLEPPFLSARGICVSPTSVLIFHEEELLVLDVDTWGRTVLRVPISGLDRPVWRPALSADGTRVWLCDFRSGRVFACAWKEAAATAESHLVPSPPALEGRKTRLSTFLATIDGR